MIDAQDVTETFKDCLSVEADTDTIDVESVINTFRFSRERLAKNAPKVRGWVAQLNDNFMEGKGGGWSFLQLCEDRNGEQWTGLHLTQESLLALAQGLDIASFLMPRPMWKLFPGGMPYIVFKD